MAGDPYSGDRARWDAVKARDERADGRFWFSVATTGVYCYPSCAARRPRRENVEFHDSRAEAESSGFRACKRCRPDLPPRRARHAEAVARACRTIESAEQAPSLKELADAAGLSPYHFQRRFKEIAGVTPKQYATAYRAQRVRQGLTNGTSVTDAMYDAGYNSSGRFYEQSSAMLGMKPSVFAEGGRGEVIRWDATPSSLGQVLVAATGKGVCAILLGDARDELLEDLTARFPRATLERAERGSDFSAWVTRALTLIETPGRKTELPLDVAGTAFQRQVWAALREIPAGATTTYRDVAKRLGRPKAVRAVGAAIAANPVAVAIPCHRVIGSDGSLRGYRWGIERKRALLDREAQE
jgi:AraC family transcriptional regulator of adaptative response/methylated-DNA-[protein]-cysteine methyltransferase